MPVWLDCVRQKKKGWEPLQDADETLFVVAGKETESDGETVLCGREHQIFPFSFTVCFSEDTEWLPDNKASVSWTNTHVVKYS